MLALKKEKGGSFDRFWESNLRFVDGALKREIEIEYGDFLPLQKRKRLTVERQKWRKLSWRFIMAPTLERYKTAVKQEARMQRMRHEVIKEKIRDAVAQGKNVDVRYGSAHSLLSAELRREGIESSRRMENTVFPWSAIVMRKLLTGKIPTREDYLRGGISTLLGAFGYEKLVLQALYGDQLTREKQYNTVSLLETTLLNSLTSTQLEDIFMHQKVREVFTLNGLPSPDFKGQIVFREAAKAFLKAKLGPTIYRKFVVL
jgi:hypothetical protein